MNGPFTREGDTITVRLEPAVRDLLGALPGLLERAGSGGRLDYRAHPDDLEAEARYRDLVGGTLEEDRAADRTAVEATAAVSELSLEEAEAWVRVIGEARLVLGERIGITEDGWEDDETIGGRPELAVLRLLGYLQEGLVEVLTL